MQSRLKLTRLKLTGSLSLRGLYGMNSVLNAVIRLIPARVYTVQQRLLSCLLLAITDVSRSDRICEARHS